MFLKPYTGLSDDGLVEMLNGSLHMQMFCGVLINPFKPIKDGKIVSAIRSIDRPYIRPIKRGKENKPTEFGAKVNNIQIDGISFIEHHSFEAFNEGVRVKQCIEYHKELTGLEVK